MRFPWSFTYIDQSENVCIANHEQPNKLKNKLNFYVNIVPADGLVPLGARPSACTLLTLKTRARVKQVQNFISRNIFTFRLEITQQSYIEWSIQHCACGLCCRWLCSTNSWQIIAKPGNSIAHQLLLNWVAVAKSQFEIENKNGFFSLGLFYQRKLNQHEVQGTYE